MNPKQFNYFVANEYPKNEKFYSESNPQKEIIENKCT
jgi:hypothetical protein